MSRPSRHAGRSGPDSSLGSRLDPHHLMLGGHFRPSGPRGVDVRPRVGAASQDRALVINDLEAVGIDPAPDPGSVVNLALGLVESERSQRPALDHDPNGPAGLADDGLESEPHGGSRAFAKLTGAADLKREQTHVAAITC